MYIHLVGVCGTGMGPLAGLLKSLGHRVGGSDRAFHPPMADALERWGVETRQGFCAGNLDPRPDLVVVGNVCRPDNAEARAAIEAAIPCRSMPAALDEFVLRGRQSFVVAGTHGKTTTTTLLAKMFLLAGCEPGFLIGGVPHDLDDSFRAGHPGGPFVIEGDEYDSAFFDKTPKFWHYRPHVVALTSLELDHIDIYPTLDAYRAAFHEFVERIPPEGLLVAYAGDPEVRALAAGARCRVRFYALEGDDCGDVQPVWSAAAVPMASGVQPFDLFVGGSFCGRLATPLSGQHNLRNVLAAIAMAAEGAGVPLDRLRALVSRVRGAKRRQELIGEAHGVRVYDDFAHHPTAVTATLAALRARNPAGRLIAVFEPRSATASRRVHQDVYAQAFRAADFTLLAPVGRPEIPPGQRLDVAAIAEQIRKHGGLAETPPGVDATVARISELAQPQDSVVVMSNGSFGGLQAKLLVALATNPEI
ncbi:MAG: Mur ligase domain-containing protein [Proteobacteria bacterium]|nr:Mur ligase domain-containing protein [Pseudomonadota bacterium]